MRYVLHIYNLCMTNLTGVCNPDIGIYVMCMHINKEYATSQEHKAVGFESVLYSDSVFVFVFAGDFLDACIAIGPILATQDLKKNTAEVR